MKKLSLFILSGLVLAGVAMARNAGIERARSGGTALQGETQTITGDIGDSSCGIGHPMQMGPDDRSCTLECVKDGAKFILADRANKVVYSLDSAGQKKAREFAGKKVKVTGVVDAKTKTIKVTSIEPAS
ncbi:MAG TPA: DUF5818 domain-containing protein [Blastocatellia bacterium]|nr:DUF5818 domain-containing protein [Blastocatellia bacterium]